MLSAFHSATAATTNDIAFFICSNFFLLWLWERTNSSCALFKFNRKKNHPRTYSVFAYFESPIICEWRAFDISIFTIILGHLINAPICMRACSDCVNMISLKWILVKISRDFNLVTVENHLKPSSNLAVSALKLFSCKWVRVNNKKSRKIITIFIHTLIVHLPHLNISEYNKSNMTFSMKMLKLRIAYVEYQQFSTMFHSIVFLFAQRHFDWVAFWRHESELMGRGRKYTYYYKDKCFIEMHSYQNYSI